MKRYRYTGGSRIVHNVSENRLDDVERDFDEKPYRLEKGDIMKLSDSEYEVLKDRFEPVKGSVAKKIEAEMEEMSEETGEEIEKLEEQESDELPSGITSAGGGGWYIILDTGEKVHGLDKAKERLAELGVK